ncbi:MAG TPA: HAD hydrolase-like protein, partial [Candidatus Methanofastidiosa archaeon]|nr:HAD hydrolase-like protein [Candidatus Methanofastidiosa archaeon]
MGIALIFDLDGTLIDVSNSYKEAIVRTIEYLRPMLDRDLIYEGMLSLKGVPNLNNDWDATYFLLKRLDGEDTRIERGKKWSNIKMIFQSIYLGKELFIRSYGEPPYLDIERGLIENETLNITKGTLEKLKSYPIGIVTSRPRIEALYALENTILGDYFGDDRMVCQDDIDKEKPDPAPLLRMKDIIYADRYVYIG